MQTLDISKYKNRHPVQDRLRRWGWNFIRLALFRFSFLHFHGWRIWLLRLCGAKIGKGCAVFPSVLIRAPWKLEMGDYSALSADVDCYSVDTIKIGSHVTVSKEAFLCCASHDISSPIMELTYRPIVIHDHAWIAARAFISPGVTVGEGAVVGACAVVTRDVEPWTVVAGNPAKMVKKRVLRDTSDGTS